MHLLQSLFDPQQFSHFEYKSNMKSLKTSPLVFPYYTPKLPRQDTSFQSPPRSRQLLFSSTMLKTTTSTDKKQLSTPKQCMFQSPKNNNDYMGFAQTAVGKSGGKSRNGQRIPIMIGNTSPKSPFQNTQGGGMRVRVSPKNGGKSMCKTMKNKGDGMKGDFSTYSSNQTITSQRQVKTVLINLDNPPTMTSLKHSTPSKLSQTIKEAEERVHQSIAWQQQYKKVQEIFRDVLPMSQNVPPLVQIDLDALLVSDRSPASNSVADKLDDFLDVYHRKSKQASFVRSIHSINDMRPQHNRSSSKRDITQAIEETTTKLLNTTKSARSFAMDQDFMLLPTQDTSNQHDKLRISTGSQFSLNFPSSLNTSVSECEQRAKESINRVIARTFILKEQYFNN